MATLLSSVTINTTGTGASRSGPAMVYGWCCNGQYADNFDFSREPIETIASGAFTVRKSGRIWYAIKAFDAQPEPLYSEPFIVASSGV